ncbi:MAG: FKBP-type peptidyl-prolyl cis-trans isomerase [Bacteroidales bacterium]|nr:FKBP-type peptidyl-prolyl cis-trans isomerase [Bacteroidales bacterium]
MNKINRSAKLAWLFLAGILIFTACKKDDDTAAKQAAKDEQIIADYLAANSIEAQRHESGLYYLITDAGTGEQPTINSTVEVFYKGYLTNGTIFDQTTNGSVTFPLKNLIEGWQIGIPMLKEGGSGTFFLPSALGYGSSATGSIPANSVLIFEIDLVTVL